MPRADIPISQQGETFIQPGTTEKLTVAAGNAQSVAITGSSLVRIASDSACHVAIGTNPVADQNSMYIPANTVELIFIPNGWKLGVINHTGSPGGSLWLTKAV